MAKKDNKFICTALNCLLDATDRSFDTSDIADRKYQFYCCKAALVLKYLHACLGSNLDFADFIKTAYRLNLICNDVLEIAECYESALNQIVHGFHSHTGSQNGVTFFYQEILACDLTATEHGFKVATSKVQRDATGSYYTPVMLADKMVEQVFESNEFRELGSLRCVDFSCGAGDFLLAAFRKLVADGFAPNEALAMLWGYDVDPIAITIAVYRLLALSGVGVTRQGERLVSGHFHFGNPLLRTDAYDEHGNKFRAYAKGLIYSSELAVSQSCFPQGGFHIILGNPPWEKVRFEERKFLKLYSPSIGAMPSKANRLRGVDNLRRADRNGVAKLYDKLTGSYAEAKDLIDPRYFANLKGEINTYALFTLLALCHLASDGRAALILKSALFTAPSNGPFFLSLLNNGWLHRVWLFGNTNKIFDIDQRERFAIALFLPHGKAGQLNVSFGNSDVTFDKSRIRLITREELSILNPNTNSLPDVDSIEMFDFILGVQERHQTFNSVYPDAHFGRLVHLTMHAKWISKIPGDNLLPIFEGKFIGQHDLRYSTFADIPEAQAYSAKASARVMTSSEKKTEAAVSRFFIDRDFWREISGNYHESLMLCWRSLTSSTNTRTTIAALSRFVPACQSVQFLQLKSVKELVILAGLFNSKPFDYLVRQKLPGIDLTQKVIGQIPVPGIEIYNHTASELGLCGTYGEEITKRVLALYKNEPDVIRLVEKGMHVDKAACGTRDEIMSELDRLFYGAYGFREEEIRIIEDAFS